MDRLHLEIDWLDGDGIQGPELAATFARLTLRIGDSVLTRAFDRDTSAARDFVRVPLYPLAEWLAFNWWTLTCEPESPAKRTHPGFHARHSLRAGREGYTLPDLDLVSAGTRTRILIPTDPMPGMNGNPADVERTTKRVSTQALFETLSDLIDRVNRRLASHGITGTALAREWAAIGAADDEESGFCRAAARLGWDPYALDDRHRHQVLTLAGRLGELYDEAAPALDPSDLEAGSRAITKALEEAGDNALPLRRLAALREEFAAAPSAESDPERAGSALARRLRGRLGAPAGPMRTWSELASMLGEDPGRLEAALRPSDRLAGLPFVGAVVTATEDGAPAFAFRRSPAQALRPSLCRALCEVLAEPGANALVTMVLSDRQDRNRAFAAELLAPASWLAERIHGPVANPRTVEELATELDIPARVVADQLISHRIVRVRPFQWGWW